MIKEVDPKDTKREGQFHLFVPYAYPMMTGARTFDITDLLKTAEKTQTDMTLLLDYCIGKAASPIEEFYLMPVNRKLMLADALAVRTKVVNQNNGTNICDIEIADDLETFKENYLTITGEAAETCTDRNLMDERFVILTSVHDNIEMDGFLPAFNGVHNNPLVVWFKPKKKDSRFFLTITFRYHHAQMDGEQAGRFFKNLENEIRQLSSAPVPSVVS